jgi:hypothetical protein
MTTPATIEELRQALDMLVGKPLTAATVSRTDQSHVLFHFGTCARREATPDEEPEGPEDQGSPLGPPITLLAGTPQPSRTTHTEFESELSLLVWCNWRIEAGERTIVCGSMDSAADDGPLLSGVTDLLSDSVADVAVNTFLDPLVIFAGGRQLRLFCDQQGREDGDDSYRLFTPDDQSYGVITGLITRGQA